MDNRFLRCYQEYKQKKDVPAYETDDRFRCLIEKPEKDDRFRCLIEDKPKEETVYYSTRTVPTSIQSTITTTQSPKVEQTVYYSTRSPTEKPKLSFEERFEQKQLERRALLQPRKRQDSALSFTSEDSFPSLPSTVKSTPTTPVLTAWSAVVRKTLDTHTSIEEFHDLEEEYREEEVVYDEDGFPRYK